MFLKKILLPLLAAVVLLTGSAAKAAQKPINCAACRKDPALVRVLPMSKVMGNGVTSDWAFSVRWWHLNGKYSHSEYLAIMASPGGSFSHAVTLKNWVGVNNWLDRFGNGHVYSNIGNGLYSSEKDQHDLVVDIARTAKRAYMFRCGKDGKSCFNLMEGKPPVEETPKTPKKRYRKIRISVAKVPQCMESGCTEKHSPAAFPFCLRNKGESNYLCPTVPTDGAGHCDFGYELSVEVGVSFSRSFDVCELLTVEQEAAGWSPLAIGGKTEVTITDSSPDKVVVSVINIFRHKPPTKTWKLVFPKRMMCVDSNCSTDHYDVNGFCFHRWEGGVTTGEALLCDAKSRQFEYIVTSPGTYSFKEDLTDAQLKAGYGFLSARETNGVTTVTITDASPSVVTVEIVNLFRHTPPPVVRQPPPPYVPQPFIPTLSTAFPPLPYNGGNGYIRTQQSEGPAIGFIPVQKIRCVRHGRLQCGECPKPPKHERPPNDTPIDGNKGPRQPPFPATGGTRPGSSPVGTPVR